MASNFITPTAVAREILRLLHTNCEFVKNCDKQHDKETTFGGMKRGASIKIRVPNQYTVRSGWPINVQETAEQYETLTVATVRGVDLYFTDAELAQDLTDFSKQVLRPAVSRLAAEIDFITYQASLPYVYNLVGTAGTTPASALVYLQAGQKMSEFLTPTSDRVAIINPAAQASSVNAMSALFNPNTTIAKQFKEGQIGAGVLGFDFFMSQNVPAITCGSRSGTILVDTTLPTEGGETLHVDGLGGATQTFAAGDVLTIGGVYAVNPETKQTLGSLQQFVVTAAATASGSEVDLVVRPKFYTSTSGGLQTVSALPIEDAAVTVVGTASTAYPQNIAMHPEAVTFATAKLEMPSDVNFKAQEVLDGISVRILRQYDINSANYPCRIDVLCGSLVQRAQMACRIIG